MKKYTWEEVRKHNTRETGLWLAIDNSVYDITNFVDSHPGGSHLLDISAGRDCTDLFKSYHNLTDRPAQILPKYKIGELETYELNYFKPDSGFYKECCQRVKEYFEKNGLHPKSPVGGLWRFAIFFSLFCWSYLVMNQILPTNGFVQLIGVVGFGLAQALFGIHQMHDSSHAAIGFNSKWWMFFNRFTMEWILGASTMSWYHQHVLGHHIYTNIMGVDPDMPLQKEGDMRFLVKQQLWKSIYKYQYIYMPILYGGLSLKFRIQDFTWTFLSEKNGLIHVNSISKWEWAHLLASKSFFVFSRIIAPLYLFGLSVQTVMFNLILSELVIGYWLAFNFQVSHISTEVMFPCDTKYQAEINKEWAVLQVLTSVDYGHDSPLTALLSGALNYQTIHHLFPGVSQYYYPAIAPIIKDVCKKYDIPFNHFPTFSGALGAHLRYLYKMGNSGQIDSYNKEINSSG